MKKTTGLWAWPVHHTLHQRLRSSEHQRIKAGRLALPTLANRGPVAPVRHQTCQWPHGEPRTEDFRFCGAPTLANRSYCAAHCAIAYIPDAADPPPPADIARDLPEEIGPDELWPDPSPPEADQDDA